MLDAAFLADFPMLRALLFDEIVELDREAGRIRARMPPTSGCRFTDLQSCAPRAAPASVSAR